MANKTAVFNGAFFTRRYNRHILMRSVKVVRVRWPSGIERVDVTSSDTIGDVVDKMAKKCGFDGKKLALIQESTKQLVPRKIKLSQLKLENGEMFRLDVPPPKKRDTTPLVPEDVPKDVRRFRAEWGENAVSAGQIAKKHIVIEQQKESKIKRILLPPEDCERVSHIVKELHFRTTRLFFLFGTLPSEEVVRVHAVTMPPQQFVNGKFNVSEKELSAAERLAQTLGLKFVGVIVSNGTKMPIIDPSVMLALTPYAKKVGDSFVVVSAMPDAGMCHLEAFQFSNQFLDLAEKEFFVDVTEKGFKPKDSVIVYTKEMTEIDVGYFLVVVAIKTRASWFPRCRFPFQALFPSYGDFAEALNRDLEVPNFVRLLDFNMLLYLETKFGGPEDVKTLSTYLINKQELPFAMANKVSELVECAAIST